LPSAPLRRALGEDMQKELALAGWREVNSSETILATTISISATSASRAPQKFVSGK